MPEKIRGVNIPEGFKTWLTKKYERRGRIRARVPFAFVQWQLHKSWKPETIRRKVAQFKKEML